jgi:hypothetical protein
MTTVRVHAVRTTSANLTMFPNGKIFDANDVFIGAGELVGVQLSSIGTATQTILMQVYDGIVLADGRPVVGGTVATNGTLDRWRVIAAGATANDQGEPQVLGAPGAQITGMRRIIGSNNMEVFLGGAAGDNEVWVPFNCRLPGMVLSFSGGTIGVTYKVHYIPHTSGGTRRRRFYGRTGTAKSMPAAFVTDL